MTKQELERLEELEKIADRLRNELERYKADRIHLLAASADKSAILALVSEAMERAGLYVQAPFDLGKEISRLASERDSVNLWCRTLERDNLELSNMARQTEARLRAELEKVTSNYLRVLKEKEICESTLTRHISDV